MSRHKNSFLINLWLETDEGEPQQPAWRGSVEHLATKQRLYFSEVTELVHFLAPWIGRRQVK